ncbi:MAG: oxidoreductase-like domain-containing protein [Caulobacterales bacterium]
MSGRVTSASLPAPPIAPEPENCCRRGCSPCIFDYYQAAFDKWEDKIRALGLSPEDVLASTGATRASRPPLSSL